MLYNNGAICALRLVPFKPQFHCSFVCHRAWNLPGERRLTGDPVRLAAWQHVSLLSCLHYEPNEWLNSHFCPVFLFCCYSEKRGMIFFRCVQGTNNETRLFISWLRSQLSRHTVATVDLVRWCRAAETSPRSEELTGLYSFLLLLVRLSHNYYQQWNPSLDIAWKIKLFTILFIYI